MTPELKGPTQEEAYQLVTKTAQKASDLIHNSIKEIPTPRQRWLIASRIINLLFSVHFRLGLEASESAIIKTEMDL